MVPTGGALTLITMIHRSTNLLNMNMSAKLGSALPRMNRYFDTRRKHCAASAKAIEMWNCKNGRSLRCSFMPISIACSTVPCLMYNGDRGVFW